MRLSFAVSAIILGASFLVGAQSALDERLHGYLTRLFPTASSFSAEPGPPRHFEARAKELSRDPMLGVAFWTTELEPLERGYDGPIKILVGMDMKGVLTKIIVVEHHEPYGYFSVDRPEFAAQFAGKNIRDPFRVGDDIDAVSRASISVSSATRAIRNSARRVARQLLTPPGTQDKGDARRLLWPRTLYGG